MSDITSITSVQHLLFSLRKIAKNLNSYHFIFFLVLILPVFQLHAQVSAVGETDAAEIQIISIIENHLYTIRTQKAIGALAVKIKEGDFSGSYLSVNGKKYPLSEETELGTNTEFKVSNLILLSQPAEEFEMYTGALKGKLEMHGYYASTSILSTPNLRAGAANCEEPYSIPPSIWRQGLTPPVKTPDSTAVEHIIIHHSAFETSDTNATQAVRFIYLYHTQTNGWDDIAYNFLIASDGTIFQGRDDFGLYQKDNVKGAHYCAKNSNTMGICLLGDYTSTEPAPAMLGALELLMAWKLNKENLSAFGSSIHPKVNGELLGNIAGHRDHCSTGTVCPGDFVYSKLDHIRSATDQLQQLCRLTTGLVKETRQNLHCYPVPASNMLALLNLPESIEEVLVYYTNGQHVVRTIQNGQIQVADLPSGLYLLKASSGSNYFSGRFIRQD